MTSWASWKRTSPIATSTRWRHAASLGLPSKTWQPAPTGCISSVMATRSAREMWGPARKALLWRNLSSSTCRVTSNSASVVPSVSGETSSPYATGPGGSFSAESCAARPGTHPLGHRPAGLEGTSGQGPYTCGSGRAGWPRSPSR
uniref:Glutathione S-transferase theta-1 n=1 Tax=Sus scrofa TaxID=9823 RepID=A0A480F1H3_PIG